MKHRYSLERKRELQEFAYKYRELLEEVLALPYPRHKEDKAVRMVQLAKKEVGYGDKTHPSDILHTLGKALERTKTTESK